jgi:hypothetical protein
MNIFSVNIDPTICAIELDDKRLNKMAIESAQLLSTYCYLNNIHIDGLYKPCYEHHPCQKWLNFNKFNFYWLLSLLNEYIREYIFRHDKDHKTSLIFCILLSNFCKTTVKFNNIDNINFPECFGIWKDKIDMNLDHYGRMQQLMNLKWHNDKRQPTWTKRTPPIYYKDLI